MKSFSDNTILVLGGMFILLAVSTGGSPVQDHPRPNAAPGNTRVNSPGGPPASAVPGHQSPNAAPEMHQGDANHPNGGVPVGTIQQTHNTQPTDRLTANQPGGVPVRGIEEMRNTQPIYSYSPPRSPDPYYNPYNLERQSPSTHTIYYVPTTTQNPSNRPERNEEPTTTTTTTSQSWGPWFPYFWNPWCYFQGFNGFGGSNEPDWLPFLHLLHHNHGCGCGCGCC